MGKMFEFIVFNRFDMNPLNKTYKKNLKRTGAKAVCFIIRFRLRIKYLGVKRFSHSKERKGVKGKFYFIYSPIIHKTIGEVKLWKKLWLTGNRSLTEIATICHVLTKIDSNFIKFIKRLQSRTKRLRQNVIFDRQARNPE